jgi:hypothetical protein
MYALFSHLFATRPQSYDLEIDNDGMRQLRDGVVERVLNRDRVRYVREWKKANILVISEHGPVWTRFLWGGIAVPKGMPNYDEIKAQLLSWERRGGRSKFSV